MVEVEEVEEAIPIIVLLLIVKSRTPCAKMPRKESFSAITEEPKLF
jgi:hypothetical protein